MDEKSYQQELIQLIRATPRILSLLETVRACNPPDWLLGAGIIRNLVWDHLHHYETPTPAPDVDVIFFDANDLRPERDAEVQQQLLTLRSDVNWEATNQAAVHLWYEDVFGQAVLPFHSSAEAVGTWPETATSVAVRLLANDEIEVVAPCGLTDLFTMIMRRNPKRVTQERFLQRVKSKNIKSKWPQVQIIYDA